MTCDETEVELVTSEALSPGAAAHLQSCAKCRAFQSSSAQLVSDAALPPPSAEEKARLSTLAPRVHAGFQRVERRRSFARRVVSLAVAACLGAAVASAALLSRLPGPDAEQPVAVSYELGFPDLEPASSSDTEDELETFEVSWPSPY